MPVTFLTPDDLPTAFDPSAINARLDAIEARIAALEVVPEPPPPPPPPAPVAGILYVHFNAFVADGHVIRNAPDLPSAPAPESP